MSHLPETGVICVIAVSIIVFTSASLLRDKQRDECSPGHVSCKCGRKAGRVSVPVRRCRRFDGYSEYCEHCTSVRKIRKRLCPRFRHCKSCKTDGCATCPDNKYGHLCNKDCRSRCFNGGTCRNNTCICPPQYTGDRCELIKAIDCKVVTKPANGHVTVTGRIATYACAPGYDLIGQHILSCRQNGTWSAEAPICEAICVIPNATEHLYFTRQELYEENEEAVMKLSAKCDDGYRILGARSVYCNLNGTWSSLPQCEKRAKCRDPDTIKNGSLQFFPSTEDEDYFEGAEVTYECDYGFVLHGSYSIICEENGRWSSRSPRCEPEDTIPVTCPLLDPLPHGSVIPGPESKTNHLVPGVRFVYSCDEDGYFLHPNQPDRYCHHDGSWQPAVPPRCVRVTTCPDPGRPDHGKRCFGYGCSNSSDPVTFTSTCVSRAEVGGVTVTLPEGSYVNGTYVEFTCAPYRNKIGPVFRRCGNDGTWTDEKQKCIPDCGRVQSGATGFISHGKVSPVENWPWHVVVRQTKGKKGPFCGGVLLGDSWVVTAAHCVTEFRKTDPVNESSLMAEFGKQNINDSSSSQDVQVRRISGIYVHHNFLPDTFDSDIALLKLSESLKITSHVKPVCLSESLPTSNCRRKSVANRSDSHASCLHANSNMNEDTPNRSDRFDSHISGFGMTNRNTSSYSKTLRSARVLVETNKTRCMENLRQHGAATFVTDNMICAGSGKMSHPCAGDSGGPLVTRYRKDNGIERWYLQGIVSWGPPDACKTNDSYGVFTDVPKFYSWIQQITSPDLYHYK